MVIGYKCRGFFQRQISPGRLLLNRWNPPTAFLGVQLALAKRCGQRPLGIFVEWDGLFLAHDNVMGSRRTVSLGENTYGYAKRLYAAGVLQINFDQGTSRRLIAKTFRVLTSRDLGEVPAFLNHWGFDVFVVGHREETLKFSAD